MILSGCYYQKPGPVEVYSWNPPSEDELKLRRFRQHELDKIAADIDMLVMKNQDLQQSLDEMEEKNRQIEAELTKMETEGMAKLAALEEKYKTSQMDSAELNVQKETLEERLFKMKQDRINRELSKKNFASAIIFFRDGRYTQSAASFQKALSQNPPGNLVDKMHFGIGSSYFRLKQYPKAVKNLDILYGRFPKSDKWFVASVMLGWIHNNMGEKSKAIYVLENALKNNPPENVKPLLENLMKVVNEEEERKDG
jgi:TolA-binding protein